jgi:hypothetical protein
MYSTQNRRLKHGIDAFLGSGGKSGWHILIHNPSLLHSRQRRQVTVAVGYYQASACR